MSRTAAPAVKAPRDYFFLFFEESQLSRFLGLDPHVCFALFAVAPIVFYALAATVLWPATAPKSRAGVLFWAKARDWHNLGLALYSTFACGVAAYDTYLFGWDNCREVENTPERNLTRYVGYTFIASKLWEFLDTMFKIYLKNDFARKIIHEEKAAKKGNKQSSDVSSSDARPSSSSSSSSSEDPDAAALRRGYMANAEKVGNLLQYYHHGSTFLLFLLVTNLPGCTHQGLLLNGGVHMLMYFHYYSPAAFPLPAWMITVAQISQLCYVTWSWTFISFHCPLYAAFPTRHRAEFLTPYALVPIFIVLFCIFAVFRFVMPMTISKKQKGQ